MRRLLLGVLAALSAAAPVAGSASEPSTSSTVSSPAPAVRNGRDIFASFLEGRADPGCDTEHSDRRWEQHFSRAPARLADDGQDVLPLFGLSLIHI